MFSSNKDFIDYTEKEIQNTAKKLNIDLKIGLRNLNEELSTKGLSNSGSSIQIKISFLEKTVDENFGDYKNIFKETQETLKKLYNEKYLNNKKIEYLSVIDHICNETINDIKKTSSFLNVSFEGNIDNIKQNKKIELQEFINKLLIENNRKKEINRNNIIKKTIGLIFTSVILTLFIGLVINYLTHKFGWNS
ncbi:MAG: hypothetical protein N2749_06585 [Clostridia bacterium]|nr:hypothetical protein [Clostridia bacterium]